MGFESLVGQAWPALEQVEIAGWRARFAEGVTARANSVSCPDGPGDIAAVEREYARRGLPPTFQVSPESRPPGLDGELARRGYAAVKHTVIMTADLAPGPVELPVAAEPSPEWLELWWSVDGRYADQLPVAARIVTGVPARYAHAELDGRIAAVGRAVPQGEWLGLWCMATAPHARRRGLARRILRALLADGHAAGARRAYLAVTAENKNAQALYAEEGFTAVSAYHYRTFPK